MDSQIVSLTEYRETNSPHLSGQAFCLDCQHEWVAVVPIGTLWLECPSCTLVRGRLKFQCERVGEQWECGCGNDLFHVTPDGVYCPNCGAWQEGL